MARNSNQQPTAQQSELSFVESVADLLKEKKIEGFEETALVDRFGGPFFVLVGFVALVMPVFSVKFRAPMHLGLITLCALGAIAFGAYSILRTKSKLLLHKPLQDLTDKRAEASMAQLIASHQYLREHTIQGEVFAWTYLGVALVLLATGIAVKIFPLALTGDDFAFVLSLLSGTIGIYGLILFRHREKKLDACTDSLLKRWDWLTAFESTKKLRGSQKEELQSGLIFDYAREGDPRSKLSLPEEVRYKLALRNLETEIARLKEENATLKNKNAKAS